MGGFGCMPGGLIGGFAIGLIEAFTARYLGTQYSNLMVFAVLLAHPAASDPAGLFGTVPGTGGLTWPPCSPPGGGTPGQRRCCAPSSC